MNPTILITFAWTVVGVAFIYGFRMWWNAPIDPSFLPIIGVAVAATLAFTLIIAMEASLGAGPISLKLPGGFGFEGASGPVALWCLCFLTIVFGLYLLGLPEAVKHESKHVGDAIHEYIKSGPPNANR